jgi:hypothetical protein
MSDLDLSGKLVYLTFHYDKWLREINSDFNIPMANRLARVIKVFDWESKEGKILKEARNKTNKWGNFNSDDFKYVLTIYCPELRKSDNKLGFSVEEVLPKYYPGTELCLFEEIPEWMLNQIKSDTWKTFKLDSNNTRVTEVKSYPKKVLKKTVKAKK